MFLAKACPPRTVEGVWSRGMEQTGWNGIGLLGGANEVTGDQ